jgi:lipoprotein-releasing system ATP-binding protein
MLEAINLHKAYNDSAKELQVLKGVNFKIEEGKFAALIGPSGAGKSTLLHILGGLDCPSQGSVIFEGQELYKLSDQQLSRIRNSRIGFVFQFYHLLSEFSVLENVMMPVLISGSNKKGIAEADEFARKLLKRVGLLDRLTHFPSQLSGGEKQRVAIVRALMNKPKLLLCDEPTGNLDSQSSAEIIALIKNINVENKMTILLVTHNEELASNAERTYHLRDGVMDSFGGK